MFKRIVTIVLASVIVLGASALLSPTPAAPRTCPKNSHLIVCPTYSFCCPNNAFCVCL